MTPSELAALAHLKPVVHVVRAADLNDRTPRTLLLGYTCDRDTWHVYLDDVGVINVLHYRETRDASGNPVYFVEQHLRGDEVPHNEAYIPDKRLYPESCDAEFCGLLVQAGVQLPFTTYDDKNHARRLQMYDPFAGWTA